MTVTIHRDVEQGSDEWLQLRCGMLTASEMKLIVSIPKVETRTKKDGTPYKQREARLAENDACRAHLYELLAQRVTNHVEPAYISDDMLRGKEDEITARAMYAEHFAPVQEVGFITREITTSAARFTIGYSPDALVGDDGLIEVKSRRQKYQAETIIGGVCPEDYILQVQTGLLVTGRQWCDFISYCGGMPMATIRVLPDPRVQEAIIAAAEAFEERLAAAMAVYRSRVADARMIPTERRVEQEMFL